MAMALGSLQSTSVTALAGAGDVRPVPTNNEVAANVSARLALTLATRYERLCLTYTTPCLDKMNYVDWAAKTENLLEIQGVWDIVSGRDTQLNNRSSADVIQAWRCNNGIVLTIISNSLEAVEYPAIRNVWHAAKAWSKLRSIHQLDGDQAYYRTLARIMWLRPNEEVNVQESSQQVENL